MKSTYKMYGVFWDKRPIKEKQIKIRVLTNSENIAMIKLSEVFQNSMSEEFAIFSKNITSLFLDKFPRANSNVLLEFYFLRILQIAEYFAIDRIFCMNQREKELTERKISELIKKHRINCWRNSSVQLNDMLNIPNRG